MTTQIGVPGFDFEIVSFDALEDAPDGGAMNIVDPGESFQMRLRFTGSGAMWTNLEKLELHYHVRYYADGIGITDEINLGEFFGHLTLGGGIYEATKAVSIANPGVYKCAATIYFFTPGHGQFTGLLGFSDDLVVMVHPHEE
ncbi:MAG: hypothetical protein H6645_11555 [Caldilineaceae bacterium]|nr:hypothetical protein [Caldilineaceae bacterium]